MIQHPWSPEPCRSCAEAISKARDQPASINAADPSVGIQESRQRASSEVSDYEALTVLRARLRDLRDEMKDGARRIEEDGDDPKSFKVDGYYTGAELLQHYALRLALLVDPLTPQREHSSDMCGCSRRANDYPIPVYCTRPKGHDGNHIAAIGPYTPDTPVLQEWPQ